MSQVQHVALIRFKPTTSAAQIAEIFSQFEYLQETIPGILRCDFGPNTSPEGLSQGFTHGLLVTFRDAAARDAYVAHPDHIRFKTSALPFLDAVVVVDFAARGN